MRYPDTMPRKQKLKVYRTPIGFHDAYVAAPSQKAALKAWGSDADLFARGIAETVTDQGLIREPLEKPGTIIRRPRGTSAEHLAALPKDEPTPRPRSPSPDDDEGPPPRPRRRATGAGTSRRAPVHKGELRAPVAARPTDESKKESPAESRPSRVRLEEAERALERAQAEHKDAIAEIRHREIELRQTRLDLEKRHEAEIAKLQASLAKVRDRYRAALEKWRD
jgi:hypothetical protein